MKDPTDQEISTARLAVNDDEKIRENYEPLRVLGQGGMGRVILARHRFLGHLVAIKKLIIPETGPDSRSCSRFLNEAKAAKRLKHPNVVQLHEFGIDTQGSPYAVMDYIEGEPLSSLLQREETLSAVRAAALCKQVAEGLAHAHEQGVVHRDIKPSNIIVQRAGAEERAVIVDFGIAKLITAAEQELSKTGEILGSPLYFSPEQALGQQTGPGSDIYSLGCMIFECVHGTPPFVSDSAVQTAMMHVNAKTPIATDASGKAKTPIDQVIERCMQKAPEDRYANAATLASDLNAIQLGKTLTDSSAHKRATHTHKALYATALCVLLLCGVIVALQTHQGTVPKATDPRMISVSFPEEPTYRYVSKGAKETVDQDMRKAFQLARKGEHSDAAYLLLGSASLLEEESMLLERQQRSFTRNSQEFKDLRKCLLVVDHYHFECYGLAAERFVEAKQFGLAAKFFKKSLVWFKDHAYYERNNPNLHGFYQGYINVLRQEHNDSELAAVQAEYKQVKRKTFVKP